MIWIYIVSYIVIGFVFILICQILNQKGYAWFNIFEIDNIYIFRLFAMIVVLFWPIVVIFYMVILVIPWLITSVYELFVGIIFGTIALFKNGKEKGDEEESEK